MRTLVLLAALLLLLPAGAAVSAPAPALRAYVSLEGRAELAVIDVASRRVVRRIAVAPGPHNVDATGDGRRVIVTSPAVGRVTIVSGRTLRVLGVVGGLSSPHDAKLTADGRFAYVTEERGGTVAVLDVERARVTARIAVGAGPHDLAVGDTIWVTRSGSRLTVLGCRAPEPSCQTRPGRLYVLGRPSAGGPAHDIDRVPDSAEAWFTYWGSSTVGAVTAVTRLTLRRPAVSGAMHLAVDYASGSRVWVVGEDGGGAILDRRGRLLRRVAIPGPLHHVTVAPAPDLVGVVRGGPGTLELLSRLSGRRVGSIGLGGAPHDVAFGLVR